MAPMALLRVSKVKCNFSEPTETRGPLVWCNPTIKTYGYEHPIARTPTEVMDSGVSSKGADEDFDFFFDSASSGKSRLMVAVGIPSEQMVRTPRTSGSLAGISQAGSHESDFSARANLIKHQAALDLAQKEVEDTQEDLRNEVEPATQKRKECMRIVIDLEDQSQGTRSPSGQQIQPLKPLLDINHQFPLLQFLISILSTHLDTALPWTFDHPSEDVLEFENDKERARRLLVNTHRLLGLHVGEMVKGASNNRYSECVQRGQEMDGLLTHAITQLSDWYETLEVKNYECFEWDDSHGVEHNIP
ncbi:hypothetical protein PPACK8108_LOCUS23526 [Phakopsora pachyrhizi]|uniref:Uncharacterized protein n=1 Tax=Phakopsora pachyrhizi TaxID=170000 RepID=A0AAV0BNC8_PHAPC|nr:hypothetical protein PPACK8108_LOCUS23526 [Phakopsora pachyrhizi]